MKDNEQELKHYIKQIRGISYKPHQVIEEYKEGYIPLLRATNILDGELDLENVIYVEESLVKEEQILQKGDILIAASSGSLKAVGKSASFKGNGKFTFGAFCKVIRPQTISSDYLSHYFNTPNFRITIQNQINGANIKNIKNEHIDKLKLFIPELTKQSQIESILNLAKNLIQKRQSQIDALEKLIQSIFNDMFGNIRINNKDFPYESIGNLVNKNIEKVKKVYSPEDKIKYIDISSIDNETNTIVGWNEVMLKEAPSRAQQCLKYNDIVVSTVRPNLKNVAHVQIKERDLVGTSGFCVLRSEKCHPLYLFRVVLSDDFTNDMVMSTSGANYPAIKASDVYNYKIPNPPLDLQNDFAKKVEKINEHKMLMEENKRELENMYNSLLKIAFNGELFKQA